MWNARKRIAYHLCLLHPANGSEYPLSCTIMAPDETVAEEATTETEVDTTEDETEDDEDEEDDE